MSCEVLPLLGLALAPLCGDALELAREVPVRGDADALAELVVCAAAALALGEAFGEALTLADGEAAGLALALIEGEALPYGDIDAAGEALAFVDAALLVL